MFEPDGPMWAPSFAHATSIVVRLHASSPRLHVVNVLSGIVVSCSADKKQFVRRANVTRASEIDSELPWCLR